MVNNTFICCMLSTINDRNDMKVYTETRMHSSRMRTVHLLTISCSVGGGGVVHLHGCRPSRMRILPLDSDPPLVNRMTDRCKNITLPQTLFAGGNNTKMNFGEI